MIPISALQLKQHFFPVVNVRANASGKENANTALDQHVICLPVIGKANHWHLELFLNQRSVDPKKPFLYDFEFHVVGVVEVSDQTPAEKRQAFAAVNGLSLLYGAAREMLLNVTARSVFGPLNLPSLNFTEVLKQAKPGPLPASDQAAQVAAAKAA